MVVVVVGASVVVDDDGGVVADSVDDGDSLLGDWVSVADDGAWLSLPGAEVPGAGVVLVPGAGAIGPPPEV